MNGSNSTKSSRLQMYILNIFALAGVGISVALTQHFYDIRNGTSGFKSFCNLGQSINCDIVAASQFSELIWGLPLSGFASGWFLTLFFVSIFAHNPFWRRESLRASFALSLFSILIAIPYIIIMAFQLKTYCLLCFAVDTLSLLSFLTVLSLKPEGFSIHKLDLSKWKIFSGILVGSLVISVFGLKTLDQSAVPSADLAEITNGILNSPALSVRTDDNFPSIGPKTAPITIVEFSDFQCPFCRIGAFGLNSVLNRYPDKVRVIFRNYPLDQACNPHVPQPAHQFACEAASAALCAQRHGKFEIAYQELFEKQASFGPGRPLEIVKNLGINDADLKACAVSQETATRITQDIEEATQLGVRSTPTFFINGYKIEGVYPIPIWNNVIEKLLLK